MNAALLAVMALVAGSSVGSVLDVCAAAGDGAWLAVQGDTGIGGESSVCLYLIDRRGAVLVDTLGVVRSDAAKCRLALRGEGGVYAASSTGTGYTAVSLRAYGRDGSMEWELMVDDVCYDAPVGLQAALDGGAVLAWDAWSPERGLWVMRASPAGGLEWKTLALPTSHPSFTAFRQMPDGVLLLAASIQAVMDDRAVVALDPLGEELGSWSACSLEASGAVTPVGIWDVQGVPLSAWSGEPDPEGLDRLVMTALHANGTTGETLEFGLHPLTGAALVQAAPWGGFIFCGVEGLPWVCGSDNRGSVTWRHDLRDGFSPSAMTATPRGTVVVAGGAGDGFFAAEVDPAMGLVWTFTEGRPVRLKGE